MIRLTTQLSAGSASARIAAPPSLELLLPPLEVLPPLELLPPPLELLPPLTGAFDPSAVGD